MTDKPTFARGFWRGVGFMILASIIGGFAASPLIGLGATHDYSTPLPVPMDEPNVNFAAGVVIAFAFAIIVGGGVYAGISLNSTAHGFANSLLFSFGASTGVAIVSVIAVLLGSGNLTVLYFAGGGSVYFAAGALLLLGVMAAVCFFLPSMTAYALSAALKRLIRTAETT